MVVTVTHDGYIKRLPPSTYRAQNRGGRGISATNTKGDDFLEHMFVALTHDYILFFTDQGKVFWLKVYDIPEQTRTSGGRAIVNLLQLSEGEKITGLVPVRKFNEDEMSVHGHPSGDGQEDRRCRRSSGPWAGGSSPWGLDEGDDPDRRGPDQGRIDHVILSHQGRDVDPVRRVAGPIDGPARLRGQGDRPGRRATRSIGMIVANGDDDPASLLTVCAHGYGKRTSLTEYRSQNRGGKGLIDIKVTDRNGPVVAIAKVTDIDEVMLTTSGGILIRTAVADMRMIGRNTQGVRLIRVEEGHSPSASLAKLPETELLQGHRRPGRPRWPTAKAPRPLRPTSLMTGSPRPRPADHIDDQDGDGEPDAE